jgi:hypothetical protein
MPAAPVQGLVIASWRNPSGSQDIDPAWHTQRGAAQIHLDVYIRGASQNFLIAFLVFISV